MPTLRSASREDEVVVPSERQSSLRSASGSPSKKRARGGYSTPERPDDEDEIEVPPAPKKKPRLGRSTELAAPKKSGAKKPPTYGCPDARHLPNPNTKATNTGRKGAYPTPEPSSESDSREDSPETSIMAPQNEDKTAIYDMPTEVSQCHITCCIP